MAITPLSYATLVLTEGGADTFVQGTITTGLANITQGWSIREVLIEWGTTVATGGSAGLPGPTSMLGVTFSVKSLTALALATDKSTLAAYKRTTNAITAASVIHGDKVWRYTYREDDNVIWAVDPIYAQLHSASTTLTLVANIRIGYAPIKLSDSQKAALLINALQA